MNHLRLHPWDVTPQETGGLHPIARRALCPIDSTCRSLATSAPCMRVLDLVSREGRGRDPFPDLDHGRPILAGDPVPMAALELRSGPSFLDRVRVTPKGEGPTCEDVETEMIRDGRRGLDWLCGQPGVDGRRLGIIGISHGAILGPCVMGADSRLSAGVFCMGGADAAMIVARSREPSVRRFRERIMQAHGLTDTDDLLRLPQAQDSRAEPMRYASAVDPRSVLLFKTRLDRIVVPEAQDKLWEALGRPRRITLPLGHLGFGLAFYYAARRAAGFFRERFARET